MTAKEFVQTIDPTLEVEYETEFSVDIDDSIIYIGIETDEEGDKLIQEFVEEEFNISMNPFLIGILHEIGHVMTYSEDIYIERLLTYNLLSLNYKENPDFVAYSKMYFKIPAEYEATKWAVEFYQDNKEFCDEFMNTYEEAEDAAV